MIEHESPTLAIFTLLFALSIITIAAVDPESTIFYFIHFSSSDFTVSINTLDMQSVYNLLF